MRTLFTKNFQSSEEYRSLLIKNKQAENMQKLSSIWKISIESNFIFSLSAITLLKHGVIRWTGDTFFGRETISLAMRILQSLKSYYFAAIHLAVAISRELARHRPHATSSTTFLPLSPSLCSFTSSFGLGRMTNALRVA